MKLNAEKVTEYEEQGFIIVEDLITDDEIEELRQQIAGIADGTVEFPPAAIEYDPGAEKEAAPVDRLRKINEGWRHNSVFLRHAQNPMLLDVVESVLGLK